MDKAEDTQTWDFSRSHWSIVGQNFSAQAAIYQESNYVESPCRSRYDILLCLFIFIPNFFSVPHCPEALRYAKVWGRDIVRSLTLAYARGCFRIRTHDQQVTKAQLYRCTTARPPWKFLHDNYLVVWRMKHKIIRIWHWKRSPLQFFKSVYGRTFNENVKQKEIQNGHFGSVYAYFLQ